MNPPCKLIIEAEPGNKIAQEIPLLRGQEVISNTGSRIVIDLGDESEPTDEQLIYLYTAGVKQVTRLKVNTGEPTTRDYSTLFGIMLAITAMGAAAFLMPGMIPVILIMFLATWVWRALLVCEEREE